MGPIQPPTHPNEYFEQRRASPAKREAFSERSNLITGPVREGTRKLSILKLAERPHGSRDSSRPYGRARGGSMENFAPHSALFTGAVALRWSAALSLWALVVRVRPEALGANVQLSHSALLFLHWDSLPGGWRHSRSADPSAHCLWSAVENHNRQLVAALTSCVLDCLFLCPVLQSR